MKSYTRGHSNSRRTLVKVGRRSVVRIARRLTANLFPRIADIVTDLVARVSDQHLILANLQEEDSVLMKTHPKQVLALLSAILPAEISKWPYGMEGILDRLQQADASLLKDDRMIDLKRRLAAG